MYTIKIYKFGLSNVYLECNTMQNKVSLNNFILIIVLFMFISCKGEKNNSGWESEVEDINELFNSFEEETNVQTEIFLNDTVNLLRPFYFRICQNFLIVRDSDDSTYLSIYDIETKSFLKRFLKKGKGPNEYLNPYFNNFGEDSIMVLDASMASTISIFSVNSILVGNNTPDRIIHLKKDKDQDITNKCFFVNNSLIGTGLFDSGRYCIYDLNGNILKKFGSFPKVISRVNYDNYHLGYIFSSREVIRGNSQFTKIASVAQSSFSIYSYDNKIEAFDQSFSLNWYTQEIGEATYKDGKPYVARNGVGAKIGAGDLVVNDKYLFFPFSKDEFIELVKQGIHDYYGYIFIFDWDGNPVAKLKLDKRIQFPLEFDSNGKKLYSTHIDTKTGFAQIVSIDVSFL